MKSLLVSSEGQPGVEPGWSALSRGSSALDVVESAIRPVESDEGIKSVGRGGTPDLIGEMACDAAVMDGDSLAAGSVGALKGALHAVSVARKVMELLPHVMLVGDGAQRFAREVGAEETELLTEPARSKYLEWLEEHVPAETRQSWPTSRLAEHAWAAARSLDTKGTVVVLARDDRGGIAAGTSTSGWAYRYPGRLGDSPAIGAGLYADSRYGACGCTHVGEMTIRAGTARSVVLYMKHGMSVEEACREAMRDLAELKGGFLGTVVVHAIDAGANPCVLANSDIGGGMEYHYWREDMPKPEHRVARLFAEQKTAR